MPRYYFHVRNHVDTDDEEGTELPDVTTAREFAVEAARDLACAAIHEGSLNLDHRIEVTDEQGQAVLMVTFRDSFTIESNR